MTLVPVMIIWAVLCTTPGVLLISNNPNAVFEEKKDIPQGEVNKDEEVSNEISDAILWED